MDNISRLEYIENEIRRLLNNKLHANLRNGQIAAQGIRIITIMLGSAVTIVLGVSDSGLSKTIALIMSVIITGIGSIEALFNFHRKFVQQYQYGTNLLVLLREIEYYKVGRPEDMLLDEDIDAFHKRYIEILSNHYTTRADTFNNSFQNAKQQSNSTSAN